MYLYGLPALNRIVISFLINRYLAQAYTSERKKKAHYNENIKGHDSQAGASPRGPLAQRQCLERLRMARPSS